MRAHIRHVVQVLIAIFIVLVSTQDAKAQGAKRTTSEAPIRDADRDHVKERNEWFFRGRLIPGEPSAELRRRAYQEKMQLRAKRATPEPASNPNTSGFWTPLGPVPLASDASGNGTQDYRQVTGRATAVVIDPADATGNTVYIGGAQSGIWKSNNAAASDASSVQWTPLTDNQATLSIGAIAIQPGNSDPAKTVILAATGDLSPTRSSEISASDSAERSASESSSESMSTNAVSKEKRLCPALFLPNSSRVLLVGTGKFRNSYPVKNNFQPLPDKAFLQAVN